MMKKMMLLALAVRTLFAVTAPAASANVELTGVGVGETNTAESNNLQLTSPWGTWACESFHLEGEVTENGSGVTIEGVTVTTSTLCPINPAPFPAVRVHKTEATLGTISIGTNGGSVPITFVYEVYQGETRTGVCHVAGNVGFGFESGTDQLTMPGSALTGTTMEGNCGTAWVMHGSFTLTNGSTGESVIID